jgi:hypothetical protein
MNKLYLKQPKNGHNDLTCPIKLLKEGKNHIGDTEYIVYSPIVDKTFCVTEDEVKTTPVDSEYVIDSEVVNKKKIILGLEPAFATSAGLSRNEDVYQAGISKRFYASCAAMQGLLANPKVEVMMKGAITQNLIKASYILADELIKQEYE